VNYRILTLLAVITVAAVAGTVCYRINSKPELRAAAQAGDPMMWLRTEFRLNEAQHARITELHQKYGSVCAEHCRLIQEAVDAAAAARKVQAEPATLAQREQRVRELQQVCEQSIEKHCREVAACMPPAEGERYLAMVLPRLSGFDHSGPPNLDLHR
jgi:hypothetical protein